MKTKLTILLIFTSLCLYSQECKCENEFDFVVNYYEENLPGFQDNVNDKNLTEYNKFKQKLKKQAKKYCDNKDLCYKTLLTYVEFFKDNHSSIYTENSSIVNEKDIKEVNHFINSETFKNRELIKNFKPKQNRTIDELENLYQLSNGVYTVAIIKNKNHFRDYVGVIVDSKTPLWKKGQVKFELKQVEKNTYDMFMYMRNHSLEYVKNVKLENGILNDTWFNINLKKKKAYNLSEKRKLIFEELDEETNYMYIPTFNGNWFAKISEFYKKNDSIIQSKPYLIIDVRNNGGGSDACVNPLLKYIYTKPFQSDKVEIYATKENIRKNVEWYNFVKKDTINYSNNRLKRIKNEIDRMKSVPNKTFVLRGEAKTIELDKVLNYPKKVAIITNKHCASSCETLLFWAVESDKTVIVGENSGGYVGYGEIGSTTTPNFNFELGCTMTRYNKHRKYEVDGIPPKYYLNNESDWIEQTLKLLKK